MKIIEDFYLGAMEAHDKSLIVNYSNNLIKNNEIKMKINIKKDM